MNNQIHVVTVVKDDLDGFLKTRNSLTSQSNLNFKWTIIDSSANRLEKLCHSQDYLNFEVDYLWREPGGIYDAMNHALKNLDSGWVLFLNAGDIFASEFSISQMIEDVSKSEYGIECIGYAVDHVSTAGHRWFTSIPTVVEVPKENYCVASINHQGFLAKISAIQTVGYFDTGLKFAADGKMMDALVLNFKYHLSDFVLSNFVIGGRSARNFKKVVKEISTYRPSSYTQKRWHFIARIDNLKNFLRLQVINLSCYLPVAELIVLRIRNLRYKRNR